MAMTRGKHEWVLATAVLALAGLGLAGCEDTPLTGQEGGELIVSASPTTVVIDQAAGDTEGQSTIAAQLFDDAGRAVVGAEVTFVTSAGSLASGGPPNVVETNATGIAVDVLTLTAADDTSVTVSAVSGKLRADATITKKISTGNVPPTASIDVEPADEAIKGTTLTFDGRASSDPDGEITCFQWQIASTSSADNVIEQGTTLRTFRHRFDVEQTLTVTLRVSDDPDAPTTFCRSGGSPAPPSSFNGIEDFLDYAIVCDPTAPMADAGTDLPLLQGPMVTVTFDGSGSRDVETGIVDYAWNCNNGTAVQSGTSPTVSCTYTNRETTVQTFTARLTVTNGCQKTAFDTVSVRVQP